VKKRCGKVKACKVAGGNKQRDYVAKEDASSPTCATESVLLTCAIDAKENRETAVVDIPNAFIQTVVEDEKDKVIIQYSWNGGRYVMQDCTRILPAVCHLR